LLGLWVPEERVFAAAFNALEDVMSPAFRSVLAKAVGLTLVLFVAVFVTVEFLVWSMQFTSWTWLDPILSVLAGLGLLVAFFFLMAPVTALFAGLFLDYIAALVESRHYPHDTPGRPLPTTQAILTGLRFGLIVLLVNLAVLPTLFFGIGAFALVLANAYLLSREYFEMAAMRHMSIAEARDLRKLNSPAILFAGFVPAILALIPFVSLIVPLFSTSYFVHLFKRLQRSSA
jgi:CysZ protein